MPEWVPYALGGAGVIISLLVGMVAFFLKDIYRDTKQTFGIVTVLQSEWNQAKEDLKRARECYTEIQLLKIDFERFKKPNGSGRYHDRS
jgi:hypothetical protein